MKHWEKVLRRASVKDKLRVGLVILEIEEGGFPADTIKLTDSSMFRARVGDWRVEFYHLGNSFRVVDVKRRDENTYK